MKKLKHLLISRISVSSGRWESAETRFESGSIDSDGADLDEDFVQSSVTYELEVCPSTTCLLALLLIYIF